MNPPLLISLSFTFKLTVSHTNNQNLPDRRGGGLLEEVKMKLLQSYLAGPTDMSHLCDQGLPPSPSLSHTEQKETHLSTEAAAYYQLICNPPSLSALDSTVSPYTLYCYTVCLSAELIDDTLIRNNLLLMLQACDCHHPTDTPHMAVAAA